MSSIHKSLNSDIEKETIDLSAYGSPAELDEIFTLLHNKFQLDFSQYRQTTINRRLIRRISLSKKKNLAGYLALLKEDPSEIISLYNDFLLNFTEFFRDPPVFSLLKKSIFPQLIENVPVKPTLRIWVPGCSTGEEVYSLAISLHEYLEEQKFQIPFVFFGTDLVKENIDIARKGIYSRDIEAQVSPERVSRYFDTLDQGYKVTRVIREKCAFSVHDLIHDPPFPRIHLISCRNVLIYLNETLQDRILPLFHYSLNSRGCLLLGTSESLGRYSDLFLKTDNQNNFFMKKDVSPNILPYRSFAAPLSKFRKIDRKDTREIKKENREGKEISGISESMDKILQAYYVPPALLIDSTMRIRQFRGDTAPFLRPSEGEASLLLSKMLPKGWLADFMVATEEVKKRNQSVKRSGIIFNDGESNKKVDFTLIPINRERGGEFMFCLVFDSLISLDNDSSTSPGNAEKEPDDERTRLKEELELTKSHLQTIIEEKEGVNQELWSYNEENQSTNEELLSINEEMEAAKEELESSNEELLTLNEELRNKNGELESLNAEIKEVLNILNDSQMIAQIGTWWVTLPGETIYWTEEAAHIFGFDSSVGSINMERFMEKVYPQDRGKVRTFYSRNNDKELVGAEKFISFRIHFPHGSKKYLEATKKLESDDKGAPQRIIGTIQDVTTRIRSEKELIKSEAFLSSIINSIQDGISVLDKSLNIIRVNPVMEKWYSNSLPLEGKKCYYSYHNRKKPCSSCPSLKALKTGKAESGIVRGPEGFSVEWLELYSHPMINTENGEIFGVIEFVRDVTAKIKTELALEESEARIKRYIEAAPVGIVVNSINGSLIDINNAALKIFGLTREEAIKKGAMNLFTPDSKEKGKEINKVLVNKGHVSSEIRFISDSGEHRVLLMEAVKLNNRGEFLSFFNDVTNQKELESQLHQTEKMQVVGQLAGGIAHDFNNQLAGIMGYADVLKEEMSEESDNQKYLDAIINIVKRASDLTGQLLAFSRKGKYLAVKVDMHAIIQEVTNLLKHSLDKKIVIRHNFSDKSCLTMGDPTQLQNLILNLALNARDAMPSGGVITIETENREIMIPPGSIKTFDIEPGPYLVISVIDTGEGIPESSLDKIFEPFFTTKAVGKGTGMGLAAVYGTIKNHKGAIEVNSLEGKGSQFTFYLPSIIE